MHFVVGLRNERWLQSYHRRARRKLRPPSGWLLLELELERRPLAHWRRNGQQIHQRTGWLLLLLLGAANLEDHFHVLVATGAEATHRIGLTQERGDKIVLLAALELEPARLGREATKSDREWTIRLLLVAFCHRSGGLIAVQPTGVVFLFGYLLLCPSVQSISVGHQFRMSFDRSVVGLRAK